MIVIVMLLHPLLFVLLNEVLLHLVAGLQLSLEHAKRTCQVFLLEHGTGRDSKEKQQG